MFLFVFVLNWRDCTFMTGSTRKLVQSPICHSPRSTANWGYFRQFLTRLVQNLTLSNNCNLIPSAHGTQQVVLSKWSLDKGFTSPSFPIQRSISKRWSEMVEDAQLSPQVVAGTQTRTEFEHSTFRFGGKCNNQYTMIASISNKDILLIKDSIMGYSKFKLMRFLTFHNLTTPGWQFRRKFLTVRKKLLPLSLSFLNDLMKDHIKFLKGINLTFD